MSYNETLWQDTFLKITASGGKEHEITARAKCRHYSGSKDYWDKSTGVWLPGDDPESELLDLKIKHGEGWLPIQPWLFETLYDDNEFLSDLAANIPEEEEV